MPSTMFPLVQFDLIEDSVADRALVEWGHWLGGCNRPFGRQSFGLFVENKLVSVAVGASTVNRSCGGYERKEVVELARLCSAPEERWATRVCLRLWRNVGAPKWPYWKIRAAVSYANSNRHNGDIYRFDGWVKLADVSGGTGGGSWGRGKTYEPKSVWAFDYVDALKKELLGRARKTVQGA